MCSSIALAAAPLLRAGDARRGARAANAPRRPRPDSYTPGRLEKLLLGGEQNDFLGAHHAAERLFRPLRLSREAGRRRHRTRWRLSPRPVRSARARGRRRGHDAAPLLGAAGRLLAALPGARAGRGRRRGHPSSQPAGGFLRRRAGFARGQPHQLSPGHDGGDWPGADQAAQVVLRRHPCGPPVSVRRPRHRHPLSVAWICALARTCSPASPSSRISATPTRSPPWTIAIIRGMPGPVATIRPPSARTPTWTPIDTASAASICTRSSSFRSSTRSACSRSRAASSPRVPTMGRWCRSISSRRSAAARRCARSRTTASATTTCSI